MSNVLVLGSFGLIGYEITCQLAKEGYSVYASSRSLDFHKDKLPYLKSLGVKNILTIDASSIDSLTSSVLYFKENNISLSGIVNAVSSRPSTSKSTSAELFGDVVLNSSLSVYLPCSVFGDFLANLNGGSIINFSSIYGITAPSPSIYHGTNMNTEPMYPFIKGGIISLTKYFSSYYASRGVRFNCISPGGVFNDQDPLFIKQYSQRVPLQRLCTASEILSSVKFFLDPKSSYVTGVNLPVDGGWTST